ncbi:Tyrosine-protein kinase transforming protein SEA [Geodia barretti]|uniref:Tyrosine-protein kinase transforming protein SEA n=1 Tax=Geodia barretti TaxID=519541 RepID=A0AA35TQ52_GEOBA|nr:Tyrosine-protein kinase transforming protein SEA [Geodia barretti]
MSNGVKTSSRETAAIIGVGVAGTVLGITAILVLVVLIYIIKRRYIKSCRSQSRINNNFPLQELTLIHDTDTEASVPHSPGIPRNEANIMTAESGLDDLGGIENDNIEHLKTDLDRKGMIVPKQLLELSSVVGQGESGLVYRGYINYASGKKIVAVKTCKALSWASDMERLMKEVSVMFSFRHCNIMPLIGVCFDKGAPLIIMPFMTGGTVLEYVRRHKESLHCTSTSEVKTAMNTCLGMCLQISKGMAYLTDQRFVHRDLAARNCMIDRNGVVKVADFGLTEDVYNTKYLSVEVSEERLPIRWMAPESIESNMFNEKTDVWSYGVTCWEIFTCGGVPYAGIHPMIVLREVRSGKRLERPSNLACCDEIWDMMESCWAGHPIQRPKFVSLTKLSSGLLEKHSDYTKLTHVII